MQRPDHNIACRTSSAGFESREVRYGSTPDNPTVRPGPYRPVTAVQLQPLNETTEFDPIALQ